MLALAPPSGASDHLGALRTNRDPGNCWGRAAGLGARVDSVWVTGRLDQSAARSGAGAGTRGN